MGQQLHWEEELPLLLPLPVDPQRPHVGRVQRWASVRDGTSGGLVGSGSFCHVSLATAGWLHHQQIMVSV